MSETSGLQVKSNNIQMQVQVQVQIGLLPFSWCKMRFHCDQWTHCCPWPDTRFLRLSADLLREGSQVLVERIKSGTRSTTNPPPLLLRPTWELPRWNFVTLADQEKNDIHVALVCNPALLSWRYKQKCSSCCLRGSISPTIHPSLCQKFSRKTEREGSGIDHSASAKRIMVYNCHTEL